MGLETPELTRSAVAVLAQVALMQTHRAGYAAARKDRMLRYSPVWRTFLTALER
jgi:hypothetical protein